MIEIELREAIPIETRTLVEMSYQLTQLRERAEAAEKELAELRAKVQSLVEILKCTCIPHNVNYQIETCYPECYACRIKTWLQQWDKSQNQASNARNIASTPSQTP